MRTRCSPSGTKHLSGNRTNLELLALGRLRGAVAKRDVRHLVRHHTSALAFALRCVDHSPIEQHRTAGQCERVVLLLAPSTCPAIAPIWNFSPLVACAVPWRSATCDISCAITPAISPSVLEASIIPRLRN